MSNSPLVNYTKISPNKTSPRKGKIKKITIHHVAGNLTVETIGNVFAPASRKASSNYGVDNKGRVGMYVEEKDRAWTSSNADNDNQAVTIEVSNNGGAPNWPVSDIALAKTIELCVDICKRNGIKKLNYTGDKSGNLTMHKWFAATNCPGPYLESKFPYIAKQVNKALGNKEEKLVDGKTLYRVQVGAYSVLDNAVKMVEKIKNLGFNTYMVKVGNLYKVQTGAYSNKANADAQVKNLKAKGLDAFITTEQGQPVNTAPAKKSITEVAKEVIKGLWGNGATRTNKLKAAGYDPVKVQQEVNKLLK